MKTLLALLLLSTPALAASPLDPWVQNSYNVRYSKVIEVDGVATAYVIWYDSTEGETSAERICNLGGIKEVWWGDLSDYIKHKRDIWAAAKDAWYECEKGR